MAEKNQIMVRPEDVFILSDKATSELHASQTSLSAQHLELLVLIDGKTSVAAIARSVRMVKPELLADMVRDLVRLGMLRLREKDDPSSLDFSDFFSAQAAFTPTAGAVAAAGQEAGKGTTSLEKQGYYVRIARRALGDRQLGPDEKLSVLVIEDEQHLSKLLKTFLSLEGFTARVAANREEILAELRRPPRPDLVLLDVVLPDADGFAILAAMRGHPALKTVPVVMLTGKSTRESVQRGLAGGADGYITKPFEVEALMTAVKAVLGLS